MKKLKYWMIICLAAADNAYYEILQEITTEDKEGETCEIIG